MKKFKLLPIVPYTQDDFQDTYCEFIDYNTFYFATIPTDKFGSNDTYCMEYMYDTDENDNIIPLLVNLYIVSIDIVSGNYIKNLEYTYVFQKFIELEPSMDFLDMEGWYFTDYNTILPPVRIEFGTEIELPVSEIDMTISTNTPINAFKNPFMTNYFKKIFQYVPEETIYNDIPEYLTDVANSVRKQAQIKDKIQGKNLISTIKSIPAWYGNKIIDVYDKNFPYYNINSNDLYRNSSLQYEKNLIEQKIDPVPYPEVVTKINYGPVPVKSFNIDHVKFDTNITDNELLDIIKKVFPNIKDHDSYTFNNGNNYENVYYPFYFSSSDFVCFDLRYIPIGSNYNGYNYNTDIYQFSISCAGGQDKNGDRYGNYYTAYEYLIFTIDNDNEYNIIQNGTWYIDSIYYGIYRNDKNHDTPTKDKNLSASDVITAPCISVESVQQVDPIDNIMIQNSLPTQEIIDCFKTIFPKLALDPQESNYMEYYYILYDDINSFYLAMTKQRDYKYISYNNSLNYYTWILTLSTPNQTLYSCEIRADDGSIESESKSNINTLYGPFYPTYIQPYDDKLYPDYNAPIIETIIETDHTADFIKVGYLNDKIQNFIQVDNSIYEETVTPIFDGFYQYDESRDRWIKLIKESE